MFHIHNSKNHARYLACLMLATALLFGLVVRPSYAQTPRTIHKRKGITSKQAPPQITSTKQNGKIAFARTA